MNETISAGRFLDVPLLDVCLLVFALRPMIRETSDRYRLRYIQQDMVMMRKQEGNVMYSGLLLMIIYAVIQRRRNTI